MLQAFLPSLPLRTLRILIKTFAFRRVTMTLCMNYFVSSLGIVTNPVTIRSVLAELKPGMTALSGDTGKQSDGMAGQQNETCMTIW